MDDLAEHYRERAQELRKTAGATSDGTVRKYYLKSVADYENMADALDAVAPADRIHPKHPSD
jgi:hypothetical protein